MRIEDLVCMDVEGDFRSDVQLSDFDDPTLNCELLKNYIFTTHAPATFGFAQRDYSAKDVLDLLKTAFTVERFSNRIVLTANYGHGKSHLALVLANFFARPVHAEEVEIILKRFEQALNNPPQFAGYRDFKKSKGEFLVVRLQGDAFSDLQEGFIRALEKALKEHDSTQNLELPFWHRQAEAWLKTLNGESLQKAETFLASQHTDLPTLLVGLRRQEAYEIVLDLAKHVTGMYPNFGREISLEELVFWAVDEVCIPNKFGGLLVLFDEFSLFLQKYMSSRSVGKLQELLNGISNRQGKSAFLAFTQQDVDSVAEAYAKGQRLEDVKKELERLPKDKRARLYSLMESVLASYLKQDQAAWEAWFPSVRPFFVQARENVLEYFGNRYSRELMWNVQAFEERVVIGCFPLHPLTTAILSSHNFEAGAGENPRTALQFVRRAWEDLRQQPAELSEDTPNLIFPTALVDFFDKQLSKKWYAAYQNALETALQALSEEQIKVLKALLVQQAVGLRLQASGQIEFLSQVIGLEMQDVKRVLRDLIAQKIIGFDRSNKVSYLWPASTRPQVVEEIIQKATDATPIDHALMEKIASELQSPEVGLNFGHPSDWEPKQIALTAEMFTAKKLTQLLQPYRSGNNGIEEGSRGLVVWLVAQSEEEKTNLRQNAQGVLDEAIGSTDHPLPVVIILPKQAVPALLEAARRFKALEDLKISEREKIGSVMYLQEKGRAEIDFKNSLNDLVGDEKNYLDIQRSSHECTVPGKYRASVQSLRNLTLKFVIAECYRQSYAYRVEFYTQYRVAGKGSNKLRTSTQNVARWLFSDTAGDSIRNLASKDIKHQLSNFYLTQKWGLLATETYAIRRPAIRPLQQAWDLIEDTFKPGCSDKPVQPVLINLLNPPYGHDYNTLTLLLSAWIGFHQHELRLSLGGKVVPISQLISFFDESKNPKDFIDRILSEKPLAISRTNPDEMFKQVNIVLEQIRMAEPFSISEADEAMASLEQALDNPRLPDAKHQEVELMLPRLKEALQNAQDYDSKAIAWLEQIEEGDFDQLIKVRDSCQELPTTSLVLPDQSPIEELKKSWEEAVTTALDTFCNSNARLDDLTDFKTHESQLKRARKALDQYPTLIRRVDGALKKLVERYEELVKQESEKTIIAQINSMTPSAALHVLYEYQKTLTELTGLTPSTEALRSEKLRRIENRIQQYERIAEELPHAVERVVKANELRQQRDLLLRNKEQVQETPLYQSLLKVQKKIDQLEEFFQKLLEVNLQPKKNPENLKAVELFLADIESEFTDCLSPAQKALLDEQKRGIERYRHQKKQEALSWLQDLGQRFKAGENPQGLLRCIETPPAFLDSVSLAQMMQLEKTLQKRLEENVLLQIETLFLKLKDTETRSQCLEKLKALMEQ